MVSGLVDKVCTCFWKSHAMVCYAMVLDAWYAKFFYAMVWNLYDMLCYDLCCKR